MRISKSLIPYLSDGIKLFSLILKIYRSYIFHFHFTSILVYKYTINYFFLKKVLPLPSNGEMRAWAQKLHYEIEIEAHTHSQSHSHGQNIGVPLAYPTALF